MADHAATPGAAVADRLRAEGLSAAPWSNAPGARYAAHAHDYDKVIACVAGSIRFGLGSDPGGRAFDLGVGDRLELPAGTRHDAVVGPSGVMCLEAHLPAGTLAEPSRRPAGEW